jgi:hypothetical protein
VLIEVPAMHFLMADGTSDLGDQNFRDTIRALYAVAHTLRFEQKASGMDFEIMPLEGFFDVSRIWTLALRVPQQINADHVNRAKSEAAQKQDLSQLGLIRVQEYWEGTAAQALHIGPYDAESPTIEKIHAFIAEKGLVTRGRHHEIYLSDPEETPAQELRTLIRQPCG